jgi:hypothetical protein
MMDLARIYIIQSQEAETPERRKFVLKKAGEYYRKVLDTAGASPEYRHLCAKARIGLGSIAEDMKDFAQAEKQYSAVLATEQLKDTPAFAMAEAAKTGLANIRDDIALPTTRPAWVTEKEEKEAEEMRRPLELPETMPASGPASGPASRPASAPAQ